MSSDLATFRQGMRRRECSAFPASIGADSDVSGLRPRVGRVALSTWSRRAGWFVGVMTTLRLVILATTDLSDTEAYYYSWSRFPGWSYYDHPPMIAWMTYLTTLFGHSAFAARIGAVACSALLGGLVYRLTSRLFTPRAGFFALVAITVPPVLFFTSFFVNPEGPLAPLWVLILWLLDDLREHDEPWRPWLLGLAIGVAFLAKYTAILAVPVALIFVALSGKTRRWLRRPSFYAGGLVALVVASPVVIWNYRHHWPSVTLHLVERVSLPGAATRPAHALHMAISQFLWMQPLVLPGLLAMLAVAIFRAREDARYRLLAVASAPVLLFFYVMMVLVSDAEPHWPIVGYLPLGIVAGAWIDERFDRARGWLRWYWRGCVGVSAAFVAVYFVHTQSAAMMRLVPGSLYNAFDDPVNETFGWNHVEAAIEEEVARLGPDAVVASNHNVLCGHITAQLDDRLHVYCPTPRRTAFDFFGRRDPPADVPVVYVSSSRYHESLERSLPGRQCARAQTVDVQRDGRSVAGYGIYACSRAVSIASAP